MNWLFKKSLLKKRANLWLKNLQIMKNLKKLMIAKKYKQKLLHNILTFFNNFLILISRNCIQKMRLMNFGVLGIRNNPNIDRLTLKFLIYSLLLLILTNSRNLRKGTGTWKMIGLNRRRVPYLKIKESQRKRKIKYLKIKESQQKIKNNG